MNIPSELKSHNCFCVWKREKNTKVPYNVLTGGRAATDHPEDFTAYDTALRVLKTGNWAGLGFRVSEGIGAFDIDKCIREDGSLNDVAAKVLERFGKAYFEISPSGKGLRGFFKVPDDFVYDKSAYYMNNRKIGLEVYLPGETNRFVTVTGNVYRDGEAELNPDALLEILDTFMKRRERAESEEDMPVCSYLTDDQVINFGSRTPKFKALMAGEWEELYTSQSEADMALADMLAYWCGRTEEQMDHIFRTSGLMRDKWDENRGGKTYGEITIAEAVAGTKKIYVPEFENLGWLEKSLKDLSPHTAPRYSSGDIGLGNLFADYYEPIARFNEDRGIWYVFNDKVWRADTQSLAVAKLGKRITEELTAFGMGIANADMRKRFLKKIMKLQTMRNRNNMIADARSEHPVPMDAFDAGKYIFNCANGTLNLETMEFREHDPEDMLTKISSVQYAPEARCERWERFVDEVMTGDRELAEYFQKAVGYALTGDTSLECMFIMYGPKSRNGKTTAVETILSVMGDYGMRVKPDTLAAHQNASGAGPSEDIARLAGARFIGICEMEKKLKLNVSLAKQLTGNNGIVARYLHENSFEFKPQGKVFIDTNYLPSVTDPTLFDSGRLKIIPFNRKFEPHEQDKTLKFTLSRPEALSGILNWCVEGYRKFKKYGLEEPQSVKLSTVQYRLNSDHIREFFEDCLTAKEGGELKPKDVYRRYNDWSVDHHYVVEDYSGFYERLKAEYTLEKRRPRNSQGTATNFINNIDWL